MQDQHKEPRSFPNRDLFLFFGIVAIFLALAIFAFYLDFSRKDAQKTNDVQAQSLDLPPEMFSGGKISYSVNAPELEGQLYCMKMNDEPGCFAVFLVPFSYHKDKNLESISVLVKIGDAAVLRQKILADTSTASE